MEIRGKVRVCWDGGGKNKLALSQVQPGSHSLLLGQSWEGKWKIKPKTEQRQISEGNRKCWRDLSRDVAGCDWTLKKTSLAAGWRINC